jgi:uncharacterized protein (TIGR00369 family)
MASIDQINDFLENHFPQCKTRATKIESRFASVFHKVDEGDLRPGGTVSGPVMFAVADAAMYIAILGEIGLVPLAVTTNININFLNKPAAHTNLTAQCRLIKVGKKLIIGDVFIYSVGQDDAVAHATGTYSIPPKK